MAHLISRVAYDNMVLFFMSLKGRELPGFRYWDRVCSAWEAYLKLKTRGFSLLGTSLALGFHCARKE